MSDAKLRKIVQPMPGESFDGYVERLAQTNYYSSSAIFSKSLVTDETDVVRAVASVVGQLTGISAASLTRISKTILQRELALDKSFILKDSVKFCPACISQVNHHQLLWNIRTVTVCCTHRLILIDRCEGCMRRIDLRDLISGVCHYCRFVFSATRQSAGTQEMIAYNEYALTLLEADLSRKYKGSFASHMRLMHHCFHLIQGLQSFIQPVGVRLRCFEKHSSVGISNYNAALALANVHWMLTDEENFQRVMQKFQRKNPDIRYEQQKKFEQLFFKSECSLVREWYETFWVQEWDRGSVRADHSVFRNNPKLLSQRHTLTMEESKKRFHTSKSILDRVAGNESHVRQENLEKRRQHRLDVSFLSSKFKSQDAWITKVEAAELLGIHANSVAKLVHEGLLPVRVGEFFSKRFLKDDVYSLLRGVVTGSRPVGAVLSLHNTLMNYKTHGLTLVKLLKSVQSGDLHTTVKGGYGQHRLTDLEFSVVELRELIIKQKSREDYYSLEDVRKILRVRDRTVLAYVAFGLLKPDIVPRESNRKLYRFNRSEVEHFKHSYITIKDASREWGFPEWKLRQCVRQGELKSVTPVTTLLLRSDFVRYIQRST